MGPSFGGRPRFPNGAQAAGCVVKRPRGNQDIKADRLIKRDAAVFAIGPEHGSKGLVALPPEQNVLTVL
jgi:hypothetical protein